MAGKRWPPCDKCGQPVRPHNNIYHFGLVTGEIHGWGVLLCQNRHLLPEGECEGSPSRAQYLEGQPRDSRFEYDASREARYRAAYQHVQATPEELLANGMPSEWAPTEGDPHAH